MAPREHGRKERKGSSRRPPKTVEPAEWGGLQVADRLVDIADELGYELETEEGAGSGESATSVGSADQIAG